MGSQKLLSWRQNRCNKIILKNVSLEQDVFYQFMVFFSTISIKAKQ